MGDWIVQTHFNRRRALSFEWVIPLPFDYIKFDNIFILKWLIKIIFKIILSKNQRIQFYIRKTGMIRSLVNMTLLALSKF